MGKVTKMDASQAALLLKKHWGIDSPLSPLPSERDINFKVEGKNKSVLKIYPKVDSNLKVRINLQNKVLTFLQEQSITVAPALIQSKKAKGLVALSKSSVADY